MSRDEFWSAAALFHLLACTAAAMLLSRVWRPARCRLPAARWLSLLAGTFAGLALLAYGMALTVPSIVARAAISRREVGAVSGRLMSQALFGEAIVLLLALAVVHGRGARRLRAAALGASALLGLATYVHAYHVEPRLLFLRSHAVDRTNGSAAGRVLRILHVTDIQAPRIGAHEEAALRMGLSQSPDLIVLTGDYVESELNHETDQVAAEELRRAMARLGFDAPLGVFATEGDAGLGCREVFAGTRVQCLVDETALVMLPEGDSLSITGLSRTRGRERDPAWLARLLERGPTGRHQLVISHAPDFVDALPIKVDLVLAGHTHGGQVVVPFFGPPVTASRLPRKYAGGLHDFRGIPLHVSRGVGMERAFSPPVRFLCPPEVCILDVRLAAHRIARSP